MLRITVVCCVLVVASAYQAISPLESKPDEFNNEEGCYMVEFNKVVPIGESVASIKDCVKYTCGQQNVIISGCSSISVGPNQETYEEKEKPYPECCPKVREITQS